MPRKLETIFIGMVCPKSSNIIVWRVYNTTSRWIIWEILLPLLEKLNKKNSNKIFLLGDFNIDVLQFKTFEPVNNFVDTLSSNFLSPLVLLPTRISNSSPTLINKIFCNVSCNSKIISGNFTSTVSVHLPHFAILENCFTYSPKSKANIFKRNLKIFLTRICLFQILRMLFIHNYSHNTDLLLGKMHYENGSINKN